MVKRRKCTDQLWAKDVREALRGGRTKRKIVVPHHVHPSWVSA